MSLTSITVKGIYRNGELRLLEKPEGVRDGDVLVTLTNVASNGADEASPHQRRERALRWLRDSGWHMGGGPYPSRDELHRRDR